MEDFKKQLEEVKVDVENIKTDQTTMVKELVFIKTQLTNHIPHILEEQTNLLKSLDSRIKPLETKDFKLTGVSEFLTLALKAIMMIAATVWTILQIVHLFVR